VKKSVYALIISNSEFFPIKLQTGHGRDSVTFPASKKLTNGKPGNRKKGMHCYIRAGFVKNRAQMCGTTKFPKISPAPFTPVTTPCRQRHGTTKKIDNNC